MDRGREARRGVTMAASNGLSRRRHRSNSLRDSPEEDGTVELRETARLRDRKKDRDRDRERDRERDRDRLNRNSKRRRSDKFMHGSNREDGGEDSSEESVNDDEEDDEDDGVGIGGGNSSVRMLPPNPPPPSSSVLNHHHHHHHHNSNSNNINSHHSRKSYPPPAKVFRASPAVSTTTSTWKAADEMIGVSVPRKARSASTKRSHECWSSGGVVVAGSGEQIHRQTSTSPVRQSTAAVLATPAPASPSSSNASARKKMKPSGPKPRPPKSSGNNKPSSSAQDEIEIEIAEVLYGMMRQPQCPSKQDNTDSISRENNINKSSNDAKSRVSSPISNSPSTAPLSSSVIPSNSSSSTAPITASAPKRKRPRPVKYEEENLSTLPVRNSPISSATKMETDQPAKLETSSPPHLEKNSGSVAAENGSFSYDLMSSQASEPPQLEVEKPESKPLLADSKGLTEVSESGGDMTVAKDEPQSPNKEPSAGAGVRLEDERRENLTLTKNNPTVSGIENHREEKFQIDLMAPPFRSSPERDGETDFASMDLQPEMKPQMKEDVKAVAIAKDKDDANTETEEKNAKTIIEESESQKPVASRDRNLDLQLDLEKNGRDSTTGPSNKLHQHAPKQQQPQPPVVPEKTALSNSLPLPLSMASWPGGLPPMGYMAPLQGVVSMDGSNVSSSTIQPPHLLFTQPRPKRCATHCYIARNIHYHQQFTRMNPFWPAAAGSASLYGAKAGNLNVVPPADLNANIPGRGVNTIHDKGQALAIFAGNNSGKDNKGSQPTAIMDASQRNKILLQQAIPPGAPNNLLQAPAFIFPLSQQAAAAAAVRPGPAKPPAATSSAVSSSVSNAVSASTTGGAGGGAAAAAAMGFNYPNMPGSETQYLAILQNNAYPFPISAAHVGAPPAYRGTHAQPMPFFNGSFYSSQMLHPSQLHQQQQQQQLPAQSQQIQHGGHQNTSISSGSSSSQKHLQNQQQQRQQNINGGSGTMQGFPAPKNQPQQQLQQHHHHQRQQQQNQQSETGGEESPSTADSRVSRMNMSIYGQNFAMPGHPPPAFALMSNATMGGATTVSGNHGDKKPQQQQPHTFPMSFASINGATTAPGFDLSSIAQNPAILQNLPEAMRHGYQIMAAAQAAQQKKNYRVSEEGNKTRGNDASPILEEENKSSMAGKPPATSGQSIAFTRPDLTDGQVSSVVDTSTRPLNLGSASARSSLSNVNVSSAQQQQQQQMQRNQQQQQHQQHQMIQLQKQQQFAAAAATAAARNKTPATSNGNVFSDHIPSSSSMAAKYPTALSGFPQNLVQNSSSSGPGQSPQWKNSVRINTSQVTSYPLAASTASSLKSLSQQQQGRTQQSHTVISFAANPNPKTSISAAQGPQGTPSNNNNNSSSSPPVMVGSPTSSVSKISAGGSPRTTATASSGGNKGSQGQASSLSSQQAKNSPSVPSRKSSPVPSILGNPNTGSKLQMTQQQHQQQLQKQALQQAQLLFTNASAYMQAQAQAQQAGSNTSSAMAAGGLFMQRHRDQQLQQQQVTSSSTGMLSLCSPVTTHSNTATSDPAKAVAAANNMKGGGGIVHPVQFSTSQSSGKSHQLVPAGFSNAHAVPTAVQVKPTEQKQPAGE